MTTSRPSLPEYAHPPLVAATLGVVLSYPLKLPDAALSEFQKELGPEWIDNWTEQTLGTYNSITDVGLASGGHQLGNVLQDRVIRVGSTQFAFTWLGTEDARYPRYENLRDGFLAVWDIWSRRQPEFVAKLHMWSVSYLNRIPQGTVWQSPADWSFCQLLPAKQSGLMEDIHSANWLLRRSELRNRLAVAWNLDQSNPPNIWLRLTACGPVSTAATEILDGMDSGRAAIVKTFSDLLSPAANAYWGLRRRET